jgi:hypothetical protein
MAMCMLVLAGARTVPCARLYWGSLGRADGTGGLPRDEVMNPTAKAGGL